ncbi:hypothetical protein [Kitasatospora arboriphila]|uniref:Uncharacterized protein n=1 Tax=Kitasatospora arboriphila TaxID=258052 RepID=A0ABN1TXX5_9ACTN
MLGVLLAVVAAVAGLLTAAPAHAAAWDPGSRTISAPKAADWFIYGDHSAATATVSRTADSTDAFWVGLDGAIATASWQAGRGWSAPRNITAPAASTGKGLSVVARNPHHLDVFWVGQGGTVATTWWDAATGWGKPFTVAPAGSASGAATSVVARNPNHLDVFWTSPAGAVSTTWWDVATGWARPFTVAPVGAAAKTATSVVARNPNHLDVFWTSPAGAVSTTWWDAATGWGRPFTISAPGTAAKTAISVVARNPNHLDVFWISPQWAVSHTWWDAAATWAKPFNLAPDWSATDTDGVTAIARNPNHLDVFWINRQGRVATTWWDAATPWGAPFPIPSWARWGISATARTPDRADLFWVDPNGAIGTTTWDEQKPTPGSHARMTSFSPASNGFQFRNDFTTEPIQNLRFGGLCGGMAYSALDYYYTHQPIPQQNILPATGTKLFNQIYSRQVPSITDNVDKWAELMVNPFGWRTNEFFNWGLQGFNGGRLQELQRSIDAGRPVPLGLFKAGNGGAGPHHQVVAIGYDLGRYRGDLGAFKEDLKIFIYDPNHPGQTVTLVPSVADHSYHYLEFPGESWMTYFVDSKYRTTTPLSLLDEPGNQGATPNQLAVTIGTGGDDLRGGSDNANIVVTFTDGRQQFFDNINNGARWIDNYAQTVVLPIYPGNAKVRSVVLSTTGGDNWNVNTLTVKTLAGQMLYQASGNPLVRFTGAHIPYTARIN